MHRRLLASAAGVAAAEAVTGRRRARAAETESAAARPSPARAAARLVAQFAGGGRAGCDPAPATVVASRWVLERELGRGAYATVYEARDLADAGAAKVAVKCVCKRKMDARKMEDEVRLMKQLRGHKNLIGLVGDFEDADTRYLVLDLMDGGELFDFLCDRGALRESEVAALVRAVASALAHLHNKGVVHADLKPENLLLRGGRETFDQTIGELCLADLGEAFQLTDLGGDVATGARRFGDDVPGTVGYWAPECVKGDPLGPKIDVWALGVVTFISLCGYHPFDPDGDRTPAKLAPHICAGTFDRTAPEWTELSPGAQQLVSSMLSADPRERPTAADVLSHEWVSRRFTFDKDLPSGSRERLTGWRLLRALRQGERQLGAAAKTAFDAVDTDGNGVIDRAELKDMFERFGQKLSSVELDDVWRSVDTDRSGGISRVEWQAVLGRRLSTSESSPKRDADAEDVHHLFLLFDEAGDDVITPRELGRAAALLGRRLSEDEAERLVKKYDVSGDGVLHEAEFALWVRDLEKLERAGLAGRGRLGLRQII